MGKATARLLEWHNQTALAVLNERVVVGVCPAGLATIQLFLPAPLSGWSHAS